MPQRLLAGDALGWVHFQAALQQVAQLRMILEDLIYPHQLIDIFPVLDPLEGHSIIHFVVLESLRQVVLAPPNHPSWQILLGVLHDHQQVLQIVMGRKQQIASVKFRYDAANRPDIA